MVVVSELISVVCRAPCIIFWLLWYILHVNIPLPRVWLIAVEIVCKMLWLLLTWIVYHWWLWLTYFCCLVKQATLWFVPLIWILFSLSWEFRDEEMLSIRFHDVHTLVKFRLYFGQGSHRHTLAIWCRLSIYLWIYLRQGLLRDCSYFLELILNTDILWLIL